MAYEKAVVKGRIGGTVETRNVFTADVIPVGGDTSLILWNAYLANIYAALQPVLSTVWVGYEFEVLIPDAGHWVPIDTHSFGIGGAATGDALPNAVAAVLIAVGGGVRHVGRKFFGPPAESIVAGNSLVAGVAATMATALAAYITPEVGIGGGTLTPGVLDDAGEFHAFVGGFVSSLLGSMRRRKPGLGM